MLSLANRLWLWIELTLIFIGGPVAFYVNSFPIPKSIPLLAVFLWALIGLLASRNFNKKSFGLNGFNGWKALYIRLTLALSVIVMLTIAALPKERIFYLPIHNTRLWIAIMIFYPIWSAFTQEVIYRGFFYFRYEKLMNNPKLFAFLNGVLFGFLHIIFKNWIAVLGAAVIGAVWAYTYTKHRSILIVSLEHAIVGDFIFTIGLGYYFYVPDF